MKTILVTGNRGYIGSILTEILMGKGYSVVGYDVDYYCGTELYSRKEPARQIIKDIRDVTETDLGGIDAVIHLAALSNDPLGELAPHLTDEINFRATLKLAEAAKRAGVKHFVYSSSQSMYGIADTSSELDEDAPKAPVTAYARTKWEAEVELKKMCSDNFLVVCFRPSTVFGASPSLRCDIVFNNLLGCAYTTGRVEIKSDGTPWRPVVHVRDVSQAFIAGLEAPKELVQCQSFNVGIKNGNYTVRQLAEIVQRLLPQARVVFTGEHGHDARTYRVSFKKILSVLKAYYKPEWDLTRGGQELLDMFKRIDFTEKQFRENCHRLPWIKNLLGDRRLDQDLRRLQ
jgi:nucleoside-diphosphate-sugar epimerase